MDYDDEDLADFQFCSSQESKIEPPLVIDSIWDCPGVPLDTIKDDDGKTILGWRCGYYLIPDGLFQDDPCLLSRLRYNYSTTL